METLTYIAFWALAHPLAFIALTPFLLVSLLTCFNLSVTLYFMICARASLREAAWELAKAVASTFKRSLPTALVLVWGFCAGIWLILRLNELLQ